ncbi:T9SS type A sorting domain-containing protein [Hymenobacter cellulosilyticus]|uniref:T9SS type A sorting domain-containing protein n=1 Tax=Hymenobacter cellulosilyticus TaxID=2932248 RepID=A0A8T9Q3K4_9BACT|nr:T9SS type A sorting domain-containing protein [Hymenobacter cellulosilyticus]UOQ71552.1 T9SS type A sorting domain-containing protein [Hymenobacter cellulosilyticus]
MKAIAAGRFHSLFLKTDGTAWACGYNRSGQLGNGTTTDAPTPVQVAASGFSGLAVGNDFSFFIKGDGTAWGSGSGGLGNLGDGGSTNALTPVRASLVCPIALSSRSATAQPAVNVYPVPAHGQVRLHLGTTETVQVQIVGETGQLLRVCSAQGPEAQLELAELPAGIYVAKIITRTGVLTQKIVLY